MTEESTAPTPDEPVPTTGAQDIDASEVAPEDVVPQDVVLEDVAPEDVVSKNVSPEQPTRVPHLSRTWVRALAIIAGLLVIVGVVALVGLPATVDGEALMVKPGMTARYVLNSDDAITAAGNLVSANDGRVIRTGGGTPATVAYKGATVATDTHLWPFRAYGIDRGDDIVEATRIVTKTVDPKVITKGEGAEETVIAVGRKGVSRTVYGVVSGDIISSVWLVEASPRVVQLTQAYSYAAPKNGVRGPKKLVALTFDDGPDPRYTPKILEILKHNNVKATFFCLSSRVEGHQALAKRIKAEGHLIANHSRTHRSLVTLAPKDLESEFRRSEQTIRHVTGVSPKFFRAPYGAVNGKVMAMAKTKKVHLVQWEVDSRDWTKPGVPKIVANATPMRNGGVIVLMHDSGGDRAQTVAALPKIIQIYKARGYTFITVDGFFR